MTSSFRRRMAIALFLAFCVTFRVAAAAPADSPLADAIEKSDLKTAHKLLEDHADVNAAQVDGMTPLHWAAVHDAATLTRLLIAAGADVGFQTRYGITPLSIACQNGHTENVELLLAAGADPNSALRGGETALMTASRTGRIGPITALLARGAAVNSKDRKGQTAIMWAAADGHVAVVDALINAGADFRTPLDSGFTPLFFAVREGRTDVVLRLLEAGVGINDGLQTEKSAGNGPKSGTSPLLLAVENGHLELAATLLSKGADPNGNGAGYTALHAITWVRKPIRGDGDPSPIGSGRLNSLEFVRTLAAHGADINARHSNRKSGGSGLNRTDATAFVLAAETGDVPLLKLLLELGADPTLTNAENSTPLLAASGVGVLANGDDSAGTEDDALETIRLLLELGADVNAVDAAGNSAMHGAAYMSWTKLVAFLAENNADVKVWNRPNKRQWTPLMIAQGHRPGNFRPSPETVAAVENAMRASGVEPPTAKPVRTDLQ